MKIKSWLLKKGLTAKDVTMLLFAFGTLLAFNALMVYGALGSCLGWGNA